MAIGGFVLLLASCAADGDKIRAGFSTIDWASKDSRIATYLNPDEVEIVSRTLLRLLALPPSHLQQGKNDIWVSTARPGVGGWISVREDPILTGFNGRKCRRVREHLRVFGIREGTSAYLYCLQPGNIWRDAWKARTGVVMTNAEPETRDSIEWAPVGTVGGIALRDSEKRLAAQAAVKALENTSQKFNGWKSTERNVSGSAYLVAQFVRKDQKNEGPCHQISEMVMTPEDQMDHLNTYCRGSDYVWRAQ